jgi:hypothetical protein
MGMNLVNWFYSCFFVMNHKSPVEYITQIFHVWILDKQKFTIQILLLLSDLSLGCNFVHFYSLPKFNQFFILFFNFVLLYFPY